MSGIAGEVDPTLGITCRTRNLRDAGQVLGREIEIRAMIAEGNNFNTRELGKFPEIVGVAIVQVQRIRSAAAAKDKSAPVRFVEIGAEVGVLKISLPSVPIAEPFAGLRKYAAMGASLCGMCIACYDL
jgi:hypothetical protein